MIHQLYLGSIEPKREEGSRICSSWCKSWWMAASEWAPDRARILVSTGHGSAEARGMMERVFLGWDRPFLVRAVAWLLERRDDLPGMLVVVPTAQSGRRLREALATAAGAILTPQMVTPGSFLQARDSDAAADWMERFAWIEVLESIGDWSAYASLFPDPPRGEGHWAGSLAGEMVGLRHALQENGLLLATAARKLADGLEAERWQALGWLEELVERKLQSWDLKSRSRVLAEGVKLAPSLSQIVLAGVPEMPPLVERALVAWHGSVVALIGAPASEVAAFSATGKPGGCWQERPLPWPGGSIQVVADPRQQASEALRVVAEMKTRPDEVALGAADTEVGDELARTFTQHGWTAFHPAAATVTGGLGRWFKLWGDWLVDPTLAALAHLFTLPETRVLIPGQRAEKAQTLAALRSRWMAVRPADLRRRVAAGGPHGEPNFTAVEDLLQATATLENWRANFLAENFTGPMSRLLATLSRADEGTAKSAQVMAEWLAAATPLIGQVKRSAGFWIGLMLGEIPTAAALPPAGRVLDVQGWLELFYEPGQHLVLCGMNDGKVPARSGGEPWLNETSREKLGLTRDADRAARDAFLYQAMLEARRDGGRVDVICGKSAAGGESLLPSRLLLASGRDELPSRVQRLFKEVEPPEAGLRWHADWQWQPRRVPPPTRLNVTSLGDYLACPFRYYLKHAVKMQTTELGRAEWDARDFGTVAHEVLERWGRDEEAKNFQKPEPIHRWLSAELDRVVAEWFGKQVPLAVRIQTEALRQRLVWLAKVQAASCAEGWEILEVERKVELPVAGVSIVAKIDRIDRHRDSGRLRVLDYKTGKVDEVGRAHRKKLGPASVLPRHLSRDCPAVYAGEDQGKSVDFLWHNLQLPLYAAALVKSGEPLAAPCYFTLRATEAEVAIHEWATFEMADLEAALACADWLAGQIAAGIFWPPAEKVTHDDYAILAAGRNFEELFQPLQSAADAM